jgi:hypothetical protein
LALSGRHGRWDLGAGELMVGFKTHSCTLYPLVNVYITMEHHHFLWLNQRTHGKLLQTGKPDLCGAMLQFLTFVVWAIMGQFFGMMICCYTWSHYKHHIFLLISFDKNAGCL